MSDDVDFDIGDIRRFEDQVRLFDAAGDKIDAVIANAGISRSSGDSLWVLDGKHSPMTTEPRCFLSEPMTIFVKQSSR